MDVIDWEDDGYETPVPSDAKYYHILIIDEDQIFSRKVALLLSKASYQVTEIMDPEVALRRIGQHPKEFDLVLAAIPMKARDPHAFLDEILAVNEDMAIIFMPPNRDIRLALNLLLSGATLVLDKPIDKHSLLSVWQHVFKKRLLAEKRKEKQNILNLTGIDLNNASLYDRQNSPLTGKEIKIENMIKAEPDQMEERKANIALGKRKDRGEAQDDQRKTRAVWNDGFRERVMKALSKDLTLQTGNAAAPPNEALNNMSDLRRRMLAVLARRQRLKAVHLPANSENSATQSTARSSSRLSNTGNSVIPQGARTGARQTSDVYPPPGMLQERVLQIRRAYSLQNQGGGMASKVVVPKQENVDELDDIGSSSEGHKA